VRSKLFDREQSQVLPDLGEIFFFGLSSSSIAGIFASWRRNLAAAAAVVTSRSPA